MCSRKHGRSSCIARRDKASKKPLSRRQQDWNPNIRQIGYNIIDGDRGSKIILCDLPYNEALNDGNVPNGKTQLEPLARFHGLDEQKSAVFLFRRGRTICCRLPHAKPRGTVQLMVETDCDTEQ
jgi:hypothetical protein